MNVQPGDEPINPDIWERPQMRVALARHNIGEVYRLLGTVGVSQRRIAALTGQNQSEVSDITQGRQVQAYDVLARIADGLGIPRGYMGLAYTDATTQQLTIQDRIICERDDLMERRTFLGLVSKIVMGAILTPDELDLLVVVTPAAPTPMHVGATEVGQLRAMAQALRTYDATHGGGSCRNAILAQTQWAESLLTADCPDIIRPDLLSAVAELKTLAGWTAHDLGLAKEARQYLTQAVRSTQESGDAAHTAIVLHYLGRVPLDNGYPAEALKYFQLGQIAAQDSRSGLAVAFLLANEAVAYAHLANPQQALTALRRAEDEYAHAIHNDHSPEFTRFFDQVALRTATARVHSTLGLTDVKHRELAITILNQALTEAPADRARQRAFNLAWLATCTLADGDLTTGTQIGNQALDAIREVRSKRLLDHLAPLQTEAQRHQHNSDARQLAHDVHLLRATV
jgi:transcriptional regulator with XRE-family HTH domain/tetratricopeptide (TPR) repeat protein